MNNAAKTVRFLDNSVKTEASSARVHYSINNRADGQEGVTVYASDYGSDLHDVFGGGTVNNSDIMTDYHEKSRIFIPKGHPLHAAALKCAAAKKAKDEARWAKTQEKRAARYSEKQAAQAHEMAEFRARIAARVTLANYLDGLRERA